MKMVLGLGNPGSKYETTRHNIGFIMCDAFAKENGLTWQAKPKFKAITAEYSIDNEKVIFIKPQTFYNLAGEAAQLVKDFYKLSNRDILIIHDELALPFGTIRTRGGGSDAGNNGIKNLSQHLGSDTSRVRIGIANEHRDMKPAEVFVLEKFTHDELEKIDILYSNVETLIQNFIQEDRLFEHKTAKI
jgi:peptidyl-tRNA hydrolase, PTH1 family